VKRPSCSGKKSITRVIGYYEGWASRRPCNFYFPEQIETRPYTHLIYAFATVDPVTFEIMPTTSQEGELMKRLTALKKNEQGLKVSVAIGGWTFNDPGPTATVFSDLARSEENQQKFFKSLIPFLSTYNFDGVDIDWEYPVDVDRSGRPEDFESFPKFMANLKKALKATNGRDELSLTIPTSYWYLQHFDIKGLEPHVDFFNYMSYDLHGTWDRG
jgi:GH18 family chitinase